MCYNCDMNYELNQLESSIEGEGQPLLFLHGWGRDKDAFAPIISNLPREYKIITLSLPGFGNSPEPAKAWTVEEYAELVRRFLDERLTPEERAELLCVTHSYGGRLAGKIKSFKKLVQIASAGIKPKRPLKYHLGLFFYKIVKALASLPLISPIFKRPHIAYRRLRSSDDYKNASPVMKEALAYAINHDQKRDFAAIACPTLLIWGQEDDTTPLWMGKTMERLIQDSALIVYPDATHQVLTERAAEIAIVIDKFFGSDSNADDTKEKDAKEKIEEKNPKEPEDDIDTGAEEIETPESAQRESAQTKNSEFGTDSAPAEISSTREELPPRAEIPSTQVMSSESEESLVGANGSETSSDALRPDAGEEIANRIILDTVVIDAEKKSVQEDFTFDTCIPEDDNIDDDIDDEDIYEEVLA